MSDKPRIIVLSDDGGKSFDWMSDGWYQYHRRGTVEAEELMRRAKRAIHAAGDVQEAIELLRDVGFEVVRQ